MVRDVGEILYGLDLVKVPARSVGSRMSRRPLPGNEGEPVRLPSIDLDG